MQPSRYDYTLCETVTVPIPKELAVASKFETVEVLYHPDAPFSIRELYDDILPALGQRYQEGIAYFLTPVRMSLEYVPLDKGFAAILTFDRAFYDVTLEQMKYLKKMIGSMSKKYPCEVIFKPQPT